MEDERIEDSKEERKEDLNRINDEKEPKIFDVSEKEGYTPSCYPACRPCVPAVVCQPDEITCVPDWINKDIDCDPAPAVFDCEPEKELIQKKCWPYCNPCNPDGSCSPDYSDSGK